VGGKGAPEHDLIANFGRPGHVQASEPFPAHGGVHPGRQARDGGVPPVPGAGVVTAAAGAGAGAGAPLVVLGVAETRHVPQ
jgi:hypothetical protein